MAKSTKGQVFGFGDRRVATTLSQMARERLGHPQKGRGGDLRYPGPSFGSIRSYLAVPIDRIPPATRVFTTGSDGVQRWRLKLGSGMVALHRRDGDPNAETWEEAQDGSRLQTMPHLDEDLTTSESGDLALVKVRAYNLCDEVIRGSDGENIQENTPVLIVLEDVWGDLYIVKVCKVVDTSSSSTSGACCLPDNACPEDIEGYLPGKRMILGVENGCWKLFDTGLCDGSSGS